MDVYSVFHKQIEEIKMTKLNQEYLKKNIFQIFSIVISYI